MKDSSRLDRVALAGVLLCILLLCALAGAVVLLAWHGWTVEFLLIALGIVFGLRRLN